MKYDDPYKYMISGYYGIESLDEYDNKIYLLNDIKIYINNYLKDNKVTGINYDELNEDIKNNTSLEHKLHDALLLLKDMQGYNAVSITIMQKLAEMKLAKKK